ncbi:hypothetical protein MRX96_026594 [Rhipicephalus microplus]
MNTNDFFKKLCVGVNFNVNKFRSDAERFKLAKEAAGKCCRSGLRRRCSQPKR